MTVASIDFRLFSNNVYNGCLWQRSHHMETRSVLLTICMGNPTVTGVIPNIGPGQRLHILFDGSLNKLLQKLWRFQWFHTPWRSCNVTVMIKLINIIHLHGHGFSGHSWWELSQIAKFMAPTWGPPGSCRPQLGPCWRYEPCYQCIVLHKTKSQTLHNNWMKICVEVNVFQYIRYLQFIIYTKFKFNLTPLTIPSICE